MISPALLKNILVCVLTQYGSWSTFCDWTWHEHVSRCFGKILNTVKVSDIQLHFYSELPGNCQRYGCCPILSYLTRKRVIIFFLYQPITLGLRKNCGYTYVRTTHPSSWEAAKSTACGKNNGFLFQDECNRLKRLILKTHPALSGSCLKSSLDTKELLFGVYKRGTQIFETIQTEDWKAAGTEHVSAYTKK
jgi:hypothetical protein